MNIISQVDEELRIANTIIGQMGKWTRLSIGARNYLALSESDTRRGGVQFRVGRGSWYVEVELTGADLYDVRFRTRRSGRVGYEALGVYFDQLPELMIFGADHCNV